MIHLPRSLFGQLTAVFGVVAAAMILLGAWGFDHQIHGAVRAVHERSLLAAAEPLAQRLQEGGIASLSEPKPPALAARFETAGGTIRYVVLDQAGTILASTPNASPGLPRQELIGQPFATFAVDRSDLHLWGLSRMVETPQGPLTLQVAQDMTSVFVVLDDVPRAAFWPIAALLGGGALVLFLANLALTRLLLAPLRRAAADAAAIGPTRARRRIDETGMPAEVLPLIRAVNGALDRLDEALSRQRRFSQDVAHELRTPLAILTTEVDLLEDRAAAARLRGDLESLAGMVGQLLEAAEATPPAPDRPVDLVALCVEVADRMAGGAAQSGRRIVLEHGPGPMPVLGHPDALHRAVRNLLDNALSHAPAGSTVTLRIRPPATVEVADRGPGVPEAQRALVFRRFWRADRGHRRGGSGIGLALVAEIAEQHGGSVGVRDNEGGGAVFVLALPPAPAGAAGQPL
ncbi:MAG TPA: ATP-binding protein, partial [Acetobacteraceae bacterium]|nr:ATP-binding protein [Acetobacteraceae bacterium]